MGILSREIVLQGYYSEVIVWRAKVSGVIVLEGVSLGVILCWQEVWRLIFLGGFHWGYLSGGQLSREKLFRGNCLLGKSPGVNCPGRNFMGVNCPGGSGPEGNYSGVTVWEENV